MIAMLIFAATLLLAVLISGLAQRSVISTAVLFLAAGFLFGQGELGLIALDPSSAIVATFAELALFSILFTDGMRLSLGDLTRAWKLPGRALLFGMPLTLLGTAILARWVAGLPWDEALLLGAVLIPTDPVFAAAILGREEVPYRVRFLLNVESGVNDGLALPVVIAMLALVESKTFPLGSVTGELVKGIALGVALPWAASWLEGLRIFGAQRVYRPLYGFAIGMLVYTLAHLIHANTYLAAFSAGVCVATVRPEIKEEFHHFGELLAELLKLSALLVFGALISRAFLSEIPFSGYAFAALALLLARPLAIALALIRSPLDWRERLVVGWFGPKGFASVVFTLMVLMKGYRDEVNWADADRLFHLAALCIAGSILAHSSTDVLVVRWFRNADEAEAPEGRGAEPESSDGRQAHRDRSKVAHREPS